MDVPKGQRQADKPGLQGPEHVLIRQNEDPVPEIKPAGVVGLVFRNIIGVEYRESLMESPLDGGLERI